MVLLEEYGINKIVNDIKNEMKFNFIKNDLSFLKT